MPFLLQLDPPIKEAFDVAYNNIYAFHSAQKSPEKSVENMKVCLCSCLYAGWLGWVDDQGLNDLRLH